MVKARFIKIIIVSLGLLIALVFLFGANLEHGSSLASFQDGLFAKYNLGEKLTPQDLRRLESNKWVALARFLAPNNMVIRQYCLIDLAKGEKGNEKKILDLSNEMAPDHIWLEGYSYWLYTKPFLEKYDEKFQSDELRKFIEEIDATFVKTAYRRGDKLYPAPFGDLRDVPLEDGLQSGMPLADASIGIITKSGDTYSMKASPLGFNMHTAERGAEIKIVDGRPQDFIFYEGYDKKYSNPFLEFFDMLDARRFISLF
jgi:hypothetical protein